MIPTAPAVNQAQEPQPRTAKTDAERSAELVRIASIGSPFALRKDKLTGKVLDAEPHERSVKWWGLQKSCLTGLLRPRRRSGIQPGADGTKRRSWL